MATSDFRLDPAEIRTLADGPAIQLADGPVRLRAPRVTDGPAWRRTTVREEDRLRAAFADPAMPWNDMVSLTAWCDRLSRQRAAARAGAMVPFVVARDDGRVSGEISFTIDPRTACAELSIWLSDRLPSGVGRQLAADAIDALFSLQRPVSRVTAPVAVSNRRAAGFMESIGFTRRATARSLRPYDGRAVDHDQWWIEPADVRRDDVVRSAHAGEPRSTTIRPRRLRGIAAALQMVLPMTRIAVRRARRHSPPAPARATTEHVQLPTEGTGAARVAGRDVGTADVRYDPGTSSLEVWTRLVDGESAEAVAAALLSRARGADARRLSWSIRPQSVEAQAAADAGLVLEGDAPEPIWAADERHQQWAMVIGSPEGLPRLDSNQEPAD